MANPESPLKTREQFLNQIWARYPAAGKNWRDVASSTGEAGELVAGRIFFEGGTARARLVSAGASLKVAFAKRVEWLEPQRVETEFSPAFLADGDWVCLRLDPTKGANGPEAEREASGALLLAPAKNAPIEPEAGFDIDRSKLWAEFLETVRAFFVRRGFIEAMTPTLVPSPGTEPFLDPFSTRWHFGSLEREFYLPTSPEFHLKKMLTRGWTRIFEFKTCFRNGEISEHHQPEFLMLEWYRAFDHLDSIADDVENLIAALAARFHRPALKLERVTMAGLFREKLGFELKPETSREELSGLAASLGIQVAHDDSWDDIFFRIFLEKIEGSLGLERPLLVRGYPPSQAALSRIGPDGFADRFEVYWRGLELANAFHELNDPDENEARFRDDAEKKKALGKKAVPVDEELILGLKTGMPPSGGIALGMDRLFMALFDLETISETRVFPIKAE